MDLGINIANLILLLRLTQRGAALKGRGIERFSNDYPAFSQGAMGTKNHGKVQLRMVYSRRSMSWKNRGDVN